MRAFIKNDRLVLSKCFLRHLDILLNAGETFFTKFDCAELSARSKHLRKCVTAFACCIKTVTLPSLIKISFTLD